MAFNAFNLRAVFSADTKDIKKGSKDAQKAVQEFEKTTESAIDNVAGLFGTSMSQISSSLSAVKGAFMSLNKGITGAGTATTGLAKAMNVLKLAIASTGIGAIVAALGSLVAYFTQTQRGADALAKVTAVLGQVFKTVTDYAIALGERIVWCFKNPADAIKSFGQYINREVGQRIEALVGMVGNLGGALTSAFSGRFKDAYNQLNLFAENFGTAITGVTQGELQQMNEKGGAVLDDFNDKIRRRVALTERQQALERKNIEWVEREAKLRQEIALEREKVEDRLNYTTEQRLAANKKAMSLTAQLYREQEAIRREELAIIQEENALSESMNKDLRAEADAKVALLGVETERAERMKEMVTKQAELTNLVKQEAAERERIEALKARKTLELTVESVSDAAIKDKLPEVTALIKPQIDVAGFHETQRQIHKMTDEFVFDIESTVEGMIAGVAQSMGEMLAGLITGDAKIEDLVGGIVSMLGQAMQQIGQALIAYGVSMEAFKKAFSNPYAAIAAGAALMAAGAALTSLIQRYSSGSASASTIGANAGLLQGGSTLSISQSSQAQSRQQAINVNVTGQLVGQGSALVAVISNENKRKGLSS